MRIFKLYRHGFTLGTNSFAPGSKRPRGDRGSVGGWSHGSTSRNIAFLRSIDETALTGAGLALTLTVRDCPATSDDWHGIRKAFERRLKRMGLIRMHWVIEWQRRGVPHLHCACYFPTDADRLLPAKIVKSWTDLVADYGASPFAQYVLPVTDSIGWFQYVSKHAARGVNHYQRSPENIPPAWQQKTGRMWGKVGDWPTKEFAEVYLADKTFFAFRRIVQRWRFADARASGNKLRIRSAKKYLQKPENLGRVLGASEWLPEESSLQVLFFLKSQGYEFR